MVGAIPCKKKRYWSLGAITRDEEELKPPTTKARLKQPLQNHPSNGGYVCIYISVCARMFGLYIYLLNFAHETWPTFETRWFGKVQFLETFFQRGLILFMASWLSHAPKSPKPKFAKNKRHFKIFKEWNFGNLGHLQQLSPIFLGFLSFSSTHSTLISAWNAGGRRAKNGPICQVSFRQILNGSPVLLAAKRCGELVLKTAVIMWIPNRKVWISWISGLRIQNIYECLGLLVNRTFSGVTKGFNPCFVLDANSNTTSPMTPEGAQPQLQKILGRGWWMSGCRHPYLLPGKHVKHVAFDHPHAVWFLQMASPAKKIGLRWSVYIADGEIPTWFGWWIPTYNISKYWGSNWGYTLW